MAPPRVHDLQNHRAAYNLVLSPALRVQMLCGNSFARLVCTTAASGEWYERAVRILEPIRPMCRCSCRITQTHVCGSAGQDQHNLHAAVSSAVSQQAGNARRVTTTAEYVITMRRGGGGAEALQAQARR
jgi:hypothetical protein